MVSIPTIDDLKAAWAEMDEAVAPLKARQAELRAAITPLSDELREVEKQIIAIERGGSVTRGQLKTLLNPFIRKAAAKAKREAENAGT